MEVFDQAIWDLYTLLHLPNALNKPRRKIMYNFIKSVIANIDFLGLIVT